MLKSFPHHRSSSSSSPVLQHYAPAQQSLSTLPLSRRGSKSSRVSILKSTSPQIPQKSQYADASTQWSPRTTITSEMAASGAEPESSTGVEKDQITEAIPTQLPPAPAASTAIPTPQPSTQPNPTGLPESPGLKRRPSRDPPVPATTSSQPLPTKRVKGDLSPVKILPLKYEFCPVEDMVVLIANMIQELIHTNDKLPPRTVVLTRFHSR